MRALVTGATSGIGRAIAAALAAEGVAVVLVARRADVLDASARALAPPADGTHERLVADLTGKAGIDAVVSRVTDETHPVDLIVHSAGIGLPPGGYLGNPIAASQAVNRLTIDAVTEITHAALPLLIARGTGGVIIVSSIAGFLPGTPALTYSASKAWATSFGQGLNHLTKGTGVTCTVVAPGFVRSGFHDSAGIDPGGIHPLAWSTPQLVARAALRGYDRGRALVVPGTLWRVVYGMSRILPSGWSRAAFAAYMRATAGGRR